MARKWVAGSKERPSPTGEKLQSGPAGCACFDDWRHFCFALREIAAGANGRLYLALKRSNAHRRCWLNVGTHGRCAIRLALFRPRQLLKIELAPLLVAVLADNLA